MAFLSKPEKRMFFQSRKRRNWTIFVSVSRQERDLAELLRDSLYGERTILHSFSASRTSAHVFHLPESMQQWVDLGQWLHAQSVAFSLPTRNRIRAENRMEKLLDQNRGTSLTS